MKRYYDDPIVDTLMFFALCIGMVSGVVISAMFRHDSPKVAHPRAPIERVQPCVAPEVHRILRTIEVTATAYCSCKLCCGPNAAGVTSRGLKCSEHPYGVAVAPKMIPYGTKMTIPGYHDGKTVVADDTGGAMRQDAANGVYHVDLRFPTHQEALNWGRKKITVCIVEQ